MDRAKIWRDSATVAAHADDVAGIKYPHADILGIADRLPEDEQSKLATIHEFLLVWK